MSKVLELLKEEFEVAMLLSGIDRYNMKIQALIIEIISSWEPS